MAVQTESPTLGRGTDWNSFYGTEPLEANDPFSPSAFGQLLFSEPDAASARSLLGIADALLDLTFADIGGTIGLDQLPPGSVASLDSIDQDALYFFNNTSGLPELISNAETVAFISPALNFSDIQGNLSIDQFPPGSVVTIDSIDEDALYFFDNTLFQPRLINAADTLTFLGITGGGSFLSANTARVDASGNDSTGTVGDTSKPFLTAQAAFTALQTAGVTTGGVVLLGNASFGDVTTSLAEVYVIGFGGGTDSALNTITLTATAPNFCMWGMSVNSGITSTSTVVNLVAEDVNVFGPISVSSAQLTITSNGRNVSLGDIIASKTYITGALNIATITATDDIHLVECKPNTLGNNYVVTTIIDSPGVTLYAINSLINQVTALGTLNLIDSRVIGANNATSIVYADVVLLPRYQMSIDFDAMAGLKLLNDSAAPGNSKYYGTDSGGTKGFFSLPAGGSGDVVGPSSSVDSEVALFNSTTGKLIKRATGTGLAVLTSGVLSTTTNNSSNWDTAFTERHQWDGAATNLVAATGRTSLGLVIGTNVQAWDADLDTLAGLTATTNNFIVSVGSAWASRTPTQVKSTLAIANTDVSGLGTLSTQNGTFSGTSSGTNTGDQTITLTGDVTGSGTGSFAATLGNIPTAVTMAGYLAATAIAAPGTPASGIGRIYIDSTGKNLAVKDDAGVVKHGVQTKASVATNFLTAISDAGVVSAAQPADSDISFTDITTGNASTSQHGFMLKYPGGTSTFLRADGTFATPGGGTVTSIATTSPISGGTITGTGTLSLLVNVDHAFTAAQSITTAPASNTAGTGLLLTDTTAASSGNQQYSPALRWTGQGWKTNATAGSQAVDFRAYVVPVQGAANPSAYWTLESAINAGSFGNAFNFFSSGGIGIGNSIDPGIGVITWAAGQAVTQNTTAPTQTASSVAGANFGITASSATAGSSNAGAAAGGAIALTSGNAARLTSGNANGGNITLSPGTGIGTGVSGVVEQRNGVNAQSFNLYNTFTDTSNYEYGGLSWTSNTFNIGTSAAGTGTARNLQLLYSGSGSGAVKIASATTRIIFGAAPSLGNAYSSGLVNISDGQNFTATSGTNVGLDIAENGAPSSTSTMAFIPLRIKPTINYSAGTPGAGNYEALKIAVTETALPTGSNYLIRASAGSGGSTDKFAITNAGLASVYNGISTAGVGNPYLVAAGRVTAQSAANASISTYTTPAADGSYEVSMNMNVTAATALSTSLNCNYTDESNTARTMIFPVTGLTGSFLAGGLVTATGAFETPVMHIRCKASTAITLYTATGTFTSVTYTAEGNIIQTK